VISNRNVERKVDGFNDELTLERKLPKKSRAVCVSEREWTEEIPGKEG
jgi:hypothetical protein